MPFTTYAKTQSLRCVKLRRSHSLILNASQIRVDGYSAIVHLSKEQRKWVKRNADVLVQLLQAGTRFPFPRRKYSGHHSSMSIDEADEVVSVKKALSSHVDLDPKVTFGVLCEQLVPQDETTDEDERAARDHLRFLVLSYMTGDIMRIQRHASKIDNESVLIDGLLKVRMSLDFASARLTPFLGHLVCWAK